MAIQTGPGVALRLAALLLAGLAVGCGGGRDEPADVVIRGTDPAGTAGALSGAPQPDGRGVVTYEGYQTVVAGEGDTVAELADRLNLSASELAAHNGLTPAHRLRAGDELVLPRRPGGRDAPDAVAVAEAPALSGLAPVPPAESTIETAPLPGTTRQPAADGFEPIPVPENLQPEWSPALAEEAIARSSGINPDGTLGAPPSAAEPVPVEPERPRDLASPDLAQYQTGDTGRATPPSRPEAEPAAAEPEPELAAVDPAIRMQRPVEGSVAIPFAPGPGGNDGVDFAAPAGTPVVAAADGEVALVSQSLGGLGTIVLLRHPGELLTVYGRIDNVSVAKGETVRRGQRIGIVSGAGDEPRLHFEVRRGAESLDPMRFL